jgi:hypothetical protein
LSETLVRFISGTIKNKGAITLMLKRRSLFLAITLALTLSVPVSAPAADTFRVFLGDSGIGNSAITASHKGSPGGADIYLQPCSESIRTDCIQSLSYQSEKSSEWLTLTPDEKIKFPVAGVPRYGSSPNDIVATLTPYPADDSKNLPAGGMSPVYKDAKAIGDNGIRYLVQARAQGTAPSEAKYSWFDMRLEIRPVSVVDYSKLNEFGFPSLQLLSNFQAASKFKFEIRSKATKNLFAGWFYGRVLQPEFKTTAISDEESLVEIVGSPLVTHVAQGDISFNDYAAIQTTSGSALPNARPGVSVYSFGATTGFANGSGAMKVWRLLNPFMRDSAGSNISAFSIRTTRNSALLTNYYPQGCEASQALDGVVSTNAAMYNPAPPSYEAKDGSLNFEVGSPHLDTSGKVIQGVYSMVVSSKIAKCIWGSDLTNSRATVSIINDAGQKQVTTSALKAMNDFYYFHISGFTYSTKKISIRLEAIPIVTPSPTASAVPGAAQVVKKITCLKGKTKKVVSGVKPVCPKGYKIK